MGSFKRKLILSSISLLMTAVCLTSTTYAWFARNSEAWTEELDFEIENHDGLLISIDGENYRSSITNDLLKKAIVAKANNIDVLADSKSGDPKLTSSFINTEFSKIAFKDVSTANVKDFITIDENNKTDGYFNIIDASSYNYISFDLYFRVNTNRLADKSYNLSFVSQAYSENSESHLPLSYVTAPDTKAKVYSAFEANGVEYKADDEITVNLANAIRIGVIHDESNKGFTIYEPYEGYGSYCIEGETDVKYNPAHNLMLQHLLAYGGGLNPLSSNKDVYKNTQKNFDKEISFAKFNAISESKYNDVKITIAIWLEGYDSDYLSTVNLTDLSFFLSFCKMEDLGGNSNE